MNERNAYENPPTYSPFTDQNSFLPNNTIITHSESYSVYPNVQPMQPFSGLNPNTNAFQSSYGSFVESVPQQIIVIGTCPACRVGMLEEDFTCLGVLLALLFFPIGILCCLALRQRRCPNCGATYE